MTVLHAAEKILMTDMPIAPVYFYTNPMLLSKHIKNFYESALGIVDWKNVYMG
jgi:oligopeptide transport system substrate-binding protein